MKRALHSDLTPTEVLHRAFGVDSLGDKAFQNHLPLSHDAYEKAGETLDRYLLDIEPSYRGDPAYVIPGTEYEVWAICDLLTEITELKFEADASPKSYKDAANRALSSIKRMLLYSHRVVIIDRLSQQMTHLVMSGVERSESRHTVAFLLAVYATLEELFDSEVVLLASGSSQPSGRAFSAEIRQSLQTYSHDLTKFAIESFRDEFPHSALSMPGRESGYRSTSSARPGLLLKDSSSIETLIRDLLILTTPLRRDRPRLDMCFDNLEVAKAYRQILRSVDNSRTDYELDRPLIFSELYSNTIIDPSAVSIRDAANIRQGEEVFERWRVLVGDVMREVTMASLDPNIRANTLRSIVQERQSEWQARFSDILKARPSFKKLFNFGDSMFTALCAGGTYAAITGPGTLNSILMGASGAIAKDVVVFALENLKTKSPIRTATALKSHFLAFGTSSTSK